LEACIESKQNANIDFLPPREHSASLLHISYLMLQQEKRSSHLPVKGHLLYDAVWIGRHSVFSEELSAFVFRVSHCIDPSDGGSRSHLAENTRNLCYQDQPVVVVGGIIAVRLIRNTWNRLCGRKGQFLPLCF